MKNKMREKFIAGIMLSAFVLTSSVTPVVAFENYGYGDASAKPSIRTGEYAMLNLSSSISIPNGDSVVNLSLRDADVTQVLRMFADQAGMNIIFSPDVSGNVTMDLVDIPLSEALDLVVKTNKLYYDIKANTLVISTQEDSLNLADRGKTLTVIPVKYVNAVALSSFMNKSIFSAKGKGSIRPGMSKGFIVATNPANNELIVTGTEEDVALVRRIVDQFDKKPAITTFKVNHTTPAEMSAALCTSLLPSMTFLDFDEGSSGGAAGIPTGFASDEDSSDDSSGGGSISVGGGKLACRLATAQKTEETTNDEETFSLDSIPLMNLSISYFPTVGTIQVIGGSETQIDMIREYIQANDKKTPQAYLEVQIISLNESGSKTFDNTWQYLSKNFSFNAGGGQGFGTHPMHPVFLAGKGFLSYDAESWDTDKNKYDTSGGASKWPWSFYDKRNYSTSPQLVYSVNYLVENNKGRVLANPRVLLTSGQSSTIDLSSDYVSKVTTQYLDNGASTAAQVQREYEIKDDNGIKVQITPFISPDGYVTLDIKPEYKTIASRLTTKGETGEEELAATLLQRRDLDLKGVRIKDGETLVIGGMIQETESKTVKKIPFLGDLPVIGMFFRSTGTDKSKEEMVIMLTPQIIVDTEDAVADDSLL